MSSPVAFSAVSRFLSLFEAFLVHHEGSARAACNTLVTRYDASRRSCLLSGPEDYIDSGLTGDLRNKVGPATGKRATPEFDTLAECCHTGRLDGSFDAKPDIEHIGRCGKQINVNLESAIFDCSLQEDLGFQRRDKTGRPMVNLFFFCLRLQVDIASIFCDSLQLQQDQSRSSTMADATPQNTFRGLPLTPEQDAEVRHYIKKNKQRGKPWDTPELTAMLKDMLEPPRNEDGESRATVDETRSATERATASIDETMEPIEANEERNAAMETEGMKGPRR